MGFTQSLKEKFAQRPELLEVDGEGHLMTVAPTGSGKTRGAAVPALLELTGPMIVMDAKGELHDMTSRRAMRWATESFVSLFDAKRRRSE